MMSDTLRGETLGTGLRRKTTSAKPAEGPYGLDAAREEQFEALFLQHWPRVYALLLNLTGSPDEAGDLALEAFTRLHDRSGLLEGETNPGGWLHRVALHLGLDAVRRWKRRQHYEMEAGRADLDGQPGAGPAELLVQKEERQAVRRVLAEMKPRSAQLLILRYSGLSYREIALLLDLAPTSIGTLLLRAENEFRQRYRAAGEEEKP